jgi:hypothetical protein
MPKVSVIAAAILFAYPLMPVQAKAKDINKLSDIEKGALSTIGAIKCLTKPNEQLRDAFIAKQDEVILKKMGALTEVMEEQQGQDSMCKTLFVEDIISEPYALFMKALKKQ